MEAINNNANYNANVTAATYPVADTGMQVMASNDDAGMAITATEVVEVKPYTLRKLSSKEVFIMSTILKNIGFKEFKGCLESDEITNLVNTLRPTANNPAEDGEEKEKPSIEKIGISIALDVAGVIISNMENAEDSIYQLLSNLSGMTKDEIAQLDMEVFVEMIIDVFKQDGFVNFIKVVSKLLK